jgi:putative ABC transport system permease protein
MFRSLAQDTRYAVRSLARSPGFTIVATITLALGIGANTAIFSLLNAVLLRPLSYADANGLVFVWSSSSAFPRAALTPGRLIDFRDGLTSLSGLAGISHLSFDLTDGTQAERVSGASVSSNFFDVLGVHALLGDPFHSGRADDRAVVLSYGFWVRRFGGDRAAIGRSLTLNGRERIVVAVMPAEFEWPSITGSGANNANPPQLWVPGALRDVPRMPQDDPFQDLASNRSTGYLRAVGRLKPGASIAQAQREAEGLSRRLASTYPRTDSALGAVVQPLREQMVGAARGPLLILMAAVAFVLAIACANAASLLIGRAASRRREIAVRLALGAGQSRIVGQFLAESLLLSFAASALGLLIAVPARSSLISLAPEEIPRLQSAGLDLRVVAFTLALALCTSVFFGIVPALQAARRAPEGDLRDGGRSDSAGRETTRARDALVCAQIAVTLVLLVCAGLLLRSFDTLARVETGIDHANVLAFDIRLSGSRSDPAQSAAYYNRLLAALRAVPGIRSAGAAVTLPIGGDSFSTIYAVEGKTVPQPGEEPSAGYQITTPGYFATLGMHIRAGRDFTESDTSDSTPVVLVNETLARQQWPGEDPVGRRLRIGRNPADPWMTIVGVVSDIRHLGPAAPPRPEVYQPHTQAPFSFMSFVVRTDTDPYALVPGIRTAVSRIDPAQPVSGVKTMEDHLRASLARPRFFSASSGAFGLIALTLAVVGLYGLISYSVLQRTREIAIRSALGARPTDLVRIVLGKAMTLAGIGIAVGTLAALPLAQFLAGLLFGVTPTDAATYVVAGFTLALVTIAASAIPAVRAARIDPAGALRG